MVQNEEAYYNNCNLSKMKKLTISDPPTNRQDMENDTPEKEKETVAPIPKAQQLAMRLYSSY